MGVAPVSQKQTSEILDLAALGPSLSVMPGYWFGLSKAQRYKWVCANIKSPTAQDLLHGVALKVADMHEVYEAGASGTPNCAFLNDGWHLITWRWTLDEFREAIGKSKTFSGAVWAVRRYATQLRALRQEVLVYKQSMTDAKISTMAEMYGAAPGKIYVADTAGFNPFFGKGPDGAG